MSKPIKIMLTTIITLTIVGIVAIILLIYVDFDESDRDPTISDMAESSFVTDEITTDLEDGQFIRVQFRIVTDNQETSEQLESGDHFVINDAIIEELTVLEGSDFRNELTSVREDVKGAINDRLDEGEVTDVFITQKAVQ